MENPVLASNRYVFKNSKDVFIDFEKIKLLSSKLKEFKRPTFPLKFHFLENFEKTLNFLLIIDCLNFCFWNKKRKWKIKINKEYKGGYIGMVKSLKEFFRENPEYLDFKKLSEISYLKFKEMFKGGKNLLLLKKRWEILRKVSFLISRKYKNSFLNFIKDEKKDILHLMFKIVKELPSFRDEREFKGKKIFFYKRAQHLIANIFSLEKSFHLETFRNINKLTAFSDYKLPQILYHFGVLRYSKELKDKISEDLKKEIEEKINELKKIKERDDKEEIERKISDLSNSLQKVGAEIYGKRTREEKKEGPDVEEGEYKEK